MMTYFKPINQSQGIALVIALVFLLVTTLIGVSTLRANLLNEKMSLNVIQREQALEAAEVALFEGENMVENYYTDIVAAVLTGTGADRVATTAAKSCTASIAGQGGVCTPKEESDNPRYQYDNWVDVVGDDNSLKVWTNSNRFRTVDEAIKNKYDLNTAPKYIVEFMGYIVDNSGASACDDPANAAFAAENGSWPYCSLDNLQFRITALATTGNYDETRVMLQSTYVVDN